MEGTHAKLSAKDSHHSPFIHLVLVVRARYMARIFTWLYVGGSQSLSEFFSTKNGSLKKFFEKDEQEKICGATDPFDMDISFLYKLLTHACGISKEPSWHTPSRGGAGTLLGADFAQTEELIKSKAVCIAYETVTDNMGRLPLLAPMSEVAGRMSIQSGALALEKSKGGSGLG